jgi:hypothetical protein
MARKVMQFLSIVLTALALVPAGAHLFELPNKIGLSKDRYFIVQDIYRGWALFGIVLIPTVAANLVLAIMLRGRGAPFWLAALAFPCIASSVAIFFIWMYPANRATNNWTVAPADWEMLRTQWEYSHAANAVMTFIALCSVTLSVLLDRK